MWGETETAGGETVATQVFRRGVIKVRKQFRVNLILTHALLGCLSDRGRH